MGNVLRAMAFAGSLVLAAGATTTGVLAQEDDSAMSGPSGTVSAEDLADAILAEVLAGIALPASGGLEIDVPAVAPSGDMNVGGSGGDINVGGNSGGDVNLGGSSGGGITVGGGTGGDVSMGGGESMPAPPPEAAAPAAPAPEGAAPPMSGGSMSTDTGY